MFYLIHAFYLALIPLHHLWSCLIELHRTFVSSHHALSKLITPYPNSSELIQTHPNSSELIKTHQNSSELIIHKGPPKFRLARPATNRYPNRPHPKREHNWWMFNLVNRDRECIAIFF